MEMNIVRTKHKKVIKIWSEYKTKINQVDSLCYVFLFFSKVCSSWTKCSKYTWSNRKKNTAARRFFQLHILCTCKHVKLNCFCSIYIINLGQAFFPLETCQWQSNLRRPELTCTAYDKCKTNDFKSKTITPGPAIAKRRKSVQLCWSSMNKPSIVESQIS